MRFLILTAVLVVATCTGKNAQAQVLDIRAGSTSLFTPGANQPCFDSTVIRERRALTRAEAGCDFADSALRLSVFATSGPGLTRVDASSEAKVVVVQFRVPAPQNASATGYVPIHVTIPVSWDGRFFNMTVAPAATATVNMTARLREGDPTDANVAGLLISQNRFHGASHGGIFNCMSVPTDLISAATMLAGCGLAVTEREAGSATVEISGVIETNQVYNIELVMRADLFAPLVVDPYNAYVPERINFSGDEFGLRWAAPATIRIGTDPHRVVDGLQTEIDELRSELEQLRSDFENHYHTYLTGHGTGHNNTEAQTPTPTYPESDAQPPAPAEGGASSGGSGAVTTVPIATSGEASNEESGGGIMGVFGAALLALFGIRRLRSGSSGCNPPTTDEKSTVIATD